MRTEVNASYDELADEYYDLVAHPTCHNLNRLSRIFIERRFLEPWSCVATVEVGSGDSCVAAILHARGYSLNGLHVTDASASMLRHSHRWAEFGASLSVCDASEIDRERGSVCLLVACLGDPYNTPAFWNEAARVVEVGGRVLFTTPSHEWSVRFRGAGDRNFDRAEFVLRNGQRLYVPSYILPLHEQVRLIEAAGFTVTAFESLGASNLHPSEPRSPKIDVFGGDVSSLVWGFEAVRMNSRVGGLTSSPAETSVQLHSRG